MAVALDTNMLTLILKPEVPPPNDPRTNAPVTRAAERVQLLVETLAEANTKIYIPATVWAEFLVVAGDSGPSFAAALKDRAAVEIVPFDAISAIEAAIDQKKALQAGNQKIEFTGSRQCVKADRQIAAIAKTRRVDALYAADKDIVNIGNRMGVNVVSLWELPLPPEEPSKTPLLDTTGEDSAEEAQLTVFPSSAPSQPSAQSAAADLPSAPPPVQVRPAIRLDGPEPPQPDSSPSAPPKPPSEQ